MRKEVKNYYEANSGSFSNITAAEIEARNGIELWLTDMPATIYFNEKPGSLAKRISLKSLHARINKPFKRFQN